MPGFTVETVKLTQLFEPKSVTATGILFNGAATASGIDTRDYDDAVILLNAGVFSGSATVDFAIYESNTDDDTTATAITGADFTQVTSANDQAVQLGSLQTKASKRYIWLRSNKSSNTDAALFSAAILQGKGDKNPVGNTAVFDLDDTI